MANNPYRWLVTANNPIIVWLQLTTPYHWSVIANNPYHCSITANNLYHWSVTANKGLSLVGYSYQSPIIGKLNLQLSILVHVQLGTVSLVDQT